MGVKYLNDAIAIDPANPLPYLKLAIGYTEGGHAAGMGGEAANRAKAYAMKALELDSTLADAHVVLATRYLYTEWDFAKSRISLKTCNGTEPQQLNSLYTLRMVSYPLGKS
ncbi:MAG: hypothetical protein MZV63_39265 [Marinilabiliales bacterium]|nr:hypothetical protein [Marinilabiliales bacterium]